MTVDHCSGEATPWPSLLRTASGHDHPVIISLHVKLLNVKHLQEQLLEQLLDQEALEGDSLTQKRLPEI